VQAPAEQRRARPSALSHSALSSTAISSFLPELLGAELPGSSGMPD